MRLLVTGVSGYLGGIALEALEGEPAVESIVGVDVKSPAVASDKLEFHLADVRDPGIGEYARGCDAALHMAFILDEIRDKHKTYDININGSINVFDSCARSGVPWMIQLSSMAVFGPHPDNPVPLREEDFPGGAPDCYYCYSKAKVEHYLMWLREKHPDLEVTVLRPTVVVGEGLDNTISWLFSKKIGLRIKGHDPLAQFIHEDDLARAIGKVLDKHLVGTYHVTSDDSIRLSEMLRRAGMRAPALPMEVLCLLADISFRLGMSPVSSHWIRMFSESMVGTSEKLKRDAGWEPRYSSSDLFDRFILGNSGTGVRPGNQRTP
jgi:UDP-glucose 4-epimerase